MGSGDMMGSQRRLVTDGHWALKWAGPNRGEVHHGYAKGGFCHHEEWVRGTDNLQGAKSS